jgi:hypothetical protein
MADSETPEISKSKSSNNLGYILGGTFFSLDIISFDFYVGL